MTDLHRIAFESSTFNFEGANNAYLLRDSGDTVLIDTAVASTATREELRTGLIAGGCELKEIDAVFLTHWHPDHAGLAAHIQDKSGATIHVHEADEPLVTGSPNDDPEITRKYAEAFERWDLPDDIREEIDGLIQLSDEKNSPQERNKKNALASKSGVETFRDGKSFRVGDLGLEAIHTPGHTAGLTSFALKHDGRREVFTGDVLLPSNTPNIGGADMRVDRPLEQYIASLKRLARGSFDHAWPGHRDPIANPTDRSAAVITHHRDRAVAILELLRQKGSASIWELGTEVFGKLSGWDILLAVGEVDAHLEYLVAHGIVDRGDGEYHALAREAAVDELFSKCALKSD